MASSEQAADFEGVVALADEALLQAKATGRDRIVVADPDGAIGGPVTLDDERSASPPPAHPPVDSGGLVPDCGTGIRSLRPRHRPPWMLWPEDLSGERGDGRPRRKPLRASTLGAAGGGRSKASRGVDDEADPSLVAGESGDGPSDLPGSRCHPADGVDADRIGQPVHPLRGHRWQRHGELSRLDVALRHHHLRRVQSRQRRHRGHRPRDLHRRRLPFRAGRPSPSGARTHSIPLSGTIVGTHHAVGPPCSSRPTEARVQPR